MHIIKLRSWKLPSGIMIQIIHAFRYNYSQKKGYNTPKRRERYCRSSANDEIFQVPTWDKHASNAPGADLPLLAYLRCCRALHIAPQRFASLDTRHGVACRSKNSTAKIQNNSK